LTPWTHPQKTPKAELAIIPVEFFKKVFISFADMDGMHKEVTTATQQPQELSNHSNTGASKQPQHQHSTQTTTVTQQASKQPQQHQQAGNHGSTASKQPHQHSKHTTMAATPPASDNHSLQSGFVLLSCTFAFFFLFPSESFFLSTKSFTHPTH
jgi:hypothetical protein